jgi:GNAT superfamily N-acetyltransferase
VTDLPPGWHTDLAVLRLAGSAVTSYDDHLVVRTPDNPTYHWGNFLLVTDPSAVDEATRWVDRFVEVFPDARHRAVGLLSEPRHEPWAALGLTVELDDVLSTDVLPELRACTDGYTARALTTADDWEQQVAAAVRENERTGEHDPVSHPTYLRARALSDQALVVRGAGAWFGAFRDGHLVADLGIVDCGGGVARYRSVGTHAEHRGRGLAGHLLGLAASWAADHGCTRWVILTEADNPAGRLYRSLGFAPGVGNVQAYRSPAAAGRPSVSL